MGAFHLTSTWILCIYVLYVQWVLHELRETVLISSALTNINKSAAICGFIFKLRLNNDVERFTEICMESFLRASARQRLSYLI